MSHKSGIDGVEALDCTEIQSEAMSELSLSRTPLDIRWELEPESPPEAPAASEAKAGRGSGREEGGLTNRCSP